MKSWLHSFVLQGITGIFLIFKYYLISNILIEDELTQFLLLLSITSISLIVLDAPFVFHSISSGQSVLDTLKSSNTFRHFILIFTLMCALIFWLLYSQRYYLTTSTILFFLIFQISETIILNYLLVIAEKGYFGQVLRLLKIILICVILNIWELGLFDIIGLIVFLNIVVYLLVLQKLSRYLNIKRLYFVFLRSGEDRIYFSSYLRNLITVTGGLLMSITIPFASVVNLDANTLQTLITTDRYVRSFENIFQSVIAWNFNKLHNLRSDISLRNTIFTLLIFAFFVIISPKLISIMFNTSFNSIENHMLQFYCLVTIFGPIMTILGLKKFIYQRRALEYSLYTIVMGLLMLLSQFQSSIRLPLQIVSPVVYIATILFMLYRINYMRSSK